MGSKSSTFLGSKGTHTLPKKIDLLDLILNTQVIKHNFFNKSQESWFQHTFNKKCFRNTLYQVWYLSRGHNILSEQNLGQQTTTLPSLVTINQKGHKILC